jgi:hypothetical protein
MHPFVKARSCCAPSTRTSYIYIGACTPDYTRNNQRLAKSYIGLTKKPRAVCSTTGELLRLAGNAASGGLPSNSSVPSTGRSFYLGMLWLSRALQRCRNSMALGAACCGFRSGTALVTRVTRLEFSILYHTIQSSYTQCVVVPFSQSCRRLLLLLLLILMAECLARFRVRIVFLHPGVKFRNCLRLSCRYPGPNFAQTLRPSRSRRC